VSERPHREPSAIFVVASLAVAALALVGVGLVATGVVAPAEPGVEEAEPPVTPPTPDPGIEPDPPVTPPTPDPEPDAAGLVAAAALAMAEVTSVEFDLERTGAPVFVDPGATIALDRAAGQVVVPDRATARLDVVIQDAFPTRVGLVAVGGEVWMSNPVTGLFEPLPPGIDLDPTRFFDPAGGWQPLLANLRHVELVAAADRPGAAHQVRGTAPAAQVTAVTAGLVRDQDVPVDLWIAPDTALVSAARFTTAVADGPVHWRLELRGYDQPYTIEPPEGAGG
jgi:lipoprotein LprG